MAEWSDLVDFEVYSVFTSAEAAERLHRDSKDSCGDTMPSMTARDAIERANGAQPGERLRRFETVCGPRGGCERETLTADDGRWTWCAACLTVYDDYRTPVNLIPAFAKTH